MCIGALGSAAVLSRQSCYRPCQAETVASSVTDNHGESAAATEGLSLRPEQNEITVLSEYCRVNKVCSSRQVG
jgi:hypothetical protein